MSSPALLFFTLSGATLTSYNFGTLSAGQSSPVIESVLWNNRGGLFTVDDAINVLISARVDAASEINDPIDQGWVYVRSSGTENPSGIPNFFDDGQSEYTQITRFNNLTTGNIPAGCGRHIFMKIIVPTTAPSQSNVSVRLVAGTGVNSYPLPYFFNRAFGDGYVDNMVQQVFPSILQQRIGYWTDVSLVTGGAYTGFIDKDYTVKVSSGTTIGYLSYQTSDDGGVTFGTAIASSTSAFTSVKTSADVDEGVKVFFLSTAGQSLAVGDKWKIHASVDPFHFIPGISDSLQGHIGFGEALVYNNRVLQNSCQLVSGLTSNATTYVFLAFDGSFSTSLSANPQRGKVNLGWFETDSTKVTTALRTAPKVTMGLDLLDDFAPIYPSISGLTWVYYRGKYKKLDEVVAIPTTTLPFGTITLLAGVTNYLQINTIDDSIITRSTGYDIDNLPLFRIGTGTTYIKAVEDDRTRIGIPTFSRSFTGTVSNVSTGLSSSFTFTNFFNRGDIKSLTITPTQVGSYSIAVYEESSFTNISYAAWSLSSTFTDPVDWWYTDRARTKKMYGFITNQTGLTTTFTVDMKVQLL